MPRKDLIQYRRGTDAQWSEANPVLEAGEVGYSIDTNEIRVGDGSTAWLDLAAIGVASEGIARIVRITQEEYDSLPLPRPNDVLYVITP